MDKTRAYEFENEFRLTNHLYQNKIINRSTLKNDYISLDELSSELDVDAIDLLGQIIKLRIEIDEKIDNIDIEKADLLRFINSPVTLYSLAHKLDMGSSVVKKLIHDLGYKVKSNDCQIPKYIIINFLRQDSNAPPKGQNNIRAKRNKKSSEADTLDDLIRLDYEKELEIAKIGLERGIYKNVGMICGYIFEDVIKIVYNEIKDTAGVNTLRKIEKVENRTLQKLRKENIQDFTVGQMVGLYKDAELLKSHSKSFKEKYKVIKSINIDWITDIRNKCSHAGKRCIASQLEVKYLYYSVRLIPVVA